jgi:formylglycine-generating enzyme required for sulfatase activity
MSNNPSGKNNGTCDDCPVETINWWETLAFANAVSTAEGLDECYDLTGCGGTTPGNDMECGSVTVNSTSGSPYDCEGYRLPTEAEWEYGARADTDLLYSGSDTLDDVGWYGTNAGATTHVVAGLDPNAWGLYDMSGNVSEWTWDWYDGFYYTGSSSTDPEGASSGSERLYRGGGWGDMAFISRIANRDPVPAGSASRYIGFRLARTNPSFVDNDSDGVSAADDCDDGDANLGDITLDADCDGVRDSVSAQGMTFLTVPNGSFDMGCTAAQENDGNCDANESLVHTVTLTRDFYLSETEVTQEQWDALMSNNPSWFGPSTAHPYCGTDCPVENVWWWDAATFANAVSAAEGLDDCYTLTGCAGTAGLDLDCSAATISVTSTSGSPYECEGYRLPTEAEWEYGARAGTDLLYSGSDTLDDVAWYSANSGMEPRSVAGMQANGWDIHGMSGNVKEWTWDWYDGSYSSSAVSDPVGASSGTERVLRGGAFSYGATNSRVSSRTIGPPGYRYYNAGFRLARTNPNFVDNDSDGVSAAEDCDDNDVSVGDCSGCTANSVPDYALSFDGANDSVQIGTGPSLVGMGSAITVEAWIRVVDDNDNFCASILSAGYPPESPVHLCYHGYLDWDYVKFQVKTASGSNSAHTGEGSVVPGQWHHVVGSYDGAYIRAYIDGVLMGETAHQADIQDAVNTTRIGMRDVGTDYYYEGDMRDVRVWSRVLYDEEVSCRASGGEPDDQSGLFGAWTMDEGTGPEVVDSSPSGLDGVIDGATWVAY